jgi:FtsZ-interacting cell division protein ZipA
MLEIINIIILILVASIAWVVWTERKSKQALDKDALNQAWREVLDDPHYIERRHYEERMRVEDEARAAAAKHAERAGPNP